VSEAHSKPQPLPNLTAVRLLAATLVLVFHLTEDSQFRVVPWALRPLIRQGFTGVSIFFVLSGFVLAYNHLQVRSKGQFYVARIARIYPLYLLALLWMVPFKLGGAHLPNDSGVAKPVVILVSALAIQTWFPNMALDLNTPGWTISVEAFFYLLFPFLIPFVVRHLKERWRWMVGLWLLFLVPPVLVNYGPHWFGHALPPRMNDILHGALLVPAMRVGEFMLGMFAGAQFRRAPRSFSGWSVSAWGAACIAGVYLSNYVTHEVVRNDLMALLYTAFLIVLAGWKSPFLETAFWQVGGEISFGIYLLQYPLIVTMRAIFNRYVPGHNYKYPLVFVLPVLAFVTYTYVEKPARRAILHRFGMRATQKPISTIKALP
jgi:peptidoglycan/LPS O-acetylase OafA/YrhL